jgi:hypothetical protein
LYHYTDISNTLKILSIDKLYKGNPSKGEKSISLTRNNMFNGTYIKFTNMRILLDVDKLLKDGFKPIPYDEIGSNYGT